MRIGKNKAASEFFSTPIVIQLISVAPDSDSQKQAPS